MDYSTKEGAKRGQTIKQDFGRDRSDDMGGRDEAMNGRSMGGGPTNLDHTIKGANSKQVVTGTD